MEYSKNSDGTRSMFFGANIDYVLLFIPVAKSSSKTAVVHCLKRNSENAGSNPIADNNEADKIFSVKKKKEIFLASCNFFFLGCTFFSTALKKICIHARLRKEKKTRVGTQRAAASRHFPVWSRQTPGGGVCQHKVSPIAPPLEIVRGLERSEGLLVFIG